MGAPPFDATLLPLRAVGVGGISPEAAARTSDGPRRFEPPSGSESLGSPALAPSIFSLPPLAF